MSKKKTKLPNKVSELIRVAVADAKKVEKNPNYQFNMSVWHNPQTAYDLLTDRITKTGKCEVCFAGSVIACTLKTKPTIEISPQDFDFDTDKKLALLDEIRCGNIALITNDIDLEDNFYYLKPIIGKINLTVEKVNELISSKYDENNGKAPWSTYLRAATMLEKVGL